MWVTEEGRTNTVALPVPSYVLPDPAFDAWTHLIETVPHQRIEEMLTERFEAALGAYPRTPDADDEFVGAAPPAERGGSGATRTRWPDGRSRMAHP